MSSEAREPLLATNLNPRLLEAAYAVRGPIAKKAQEYEKELKDGVDLPFKKVLQCNIGETFEGAFRDCD